MFMNAAVALVEDLEWRGVHQQAGPGSQDDKVEPLQRQGPLWDLYRKLHQQRWKLDARSYGTAFRWAPMPSHPPPPSSYHL